MSGCLCGCDSASFAPDVLAHLCVPAISPQSRGEGALLAGCLSTAWVDPGMLGDPE